ncbi:hypothetical protein D3C73_733670 [compost metagenome]
MHNEITSNIEYMSDSLQQIARILESERHVSQHMAKLVREMPIKGPFEGRIDTYINHSTLVTKSVAAYLNSLAGLEDAVTECLTTVMRETKETGDE